MMDQQTQTILPVDPLEFLLLHYVDLNSTTLESTPNESTPPKPASSEESASTATSATTKEAVARSEPAKMAVAPAVTPSSAAVEAPVPVVSPAPSVNDSQQQQAVLVLISKQSLKREVTANQEKAMTVLTAQNINHEVIDGADPNNKEKRNELFEISGLRGQYPQFFIKEGDRIVSFWGDWDKFEYSNENGTIANDFKASFTEPSSTQKDIAKSTSDTPAPASAAGKAVGNQTKTVLILCSNQSLKREVVANQDKAYTILHMNNVRFEKLDGADPNNKDKRNELFTISGIRAEYPQFFLVDDTTTTFWGNWERFEFCNENGTLINDLLASA